MAVIWERIGKEQAMKEVIVKRGINGFKYSVYTESGSFIFNAESMKQIRDWYRYELRQGLLRIRKESECRK